MYSELLPEQGVQEGARPMVSWPYTDFPGLGAVGSQLVFF